MKVIVALILSMACCVAAGSTKPRSLRRLKGEDDMMSDSKDSKDSKDEKMGGKKKKMKGGKMDTMDSKKSKDNRGKRGVQPVIFDTDYGPFIDDVFALGLIVNSGDLLDLKYVITTSEDVDLSAKCVTKHLDLAGRSDIRVGTGTPFPPYEERGGVCAVPGLVGFALSAECEDVEPTFDADGVGEVAKMIMDSDRYDWMYIVVGGQTSVRTLVEQYPEAAERVETLVVMGGNWCADFEPYPDVLAPTDETNIACDPAAANIALDSSISPFEKVVYVPVVVAAEIGGDDYIKIVQAADSGADPGAAATLNFYRAWSAAGRANPDLLIHLEALSYDPNTESTPQFDACALMVAMEMLSGCEPRAALFDIPAVHFLEAGEGVAFPDSPRSAFSLLPEGFSVYSLPEQCPALTPYTFNPDDTPEMEKGVSAALGFVSLEAEASFFAEMAARMAGETIDGCYYP